MTALTSPFASHIARLRAHQGALGVAYIREGRFLAEFERLTVGWPDDVLSETLVRKYLAGRTEGGRPHRLTVMRALARFLSSKSHGRSCRRRDFSASGDDGHPRFACCRARRQVGSARLRRLAYMSAVPRGLIRGTALRSVAAHGSPARRTAGAARSGCRSARAGATVRCGKFGKTSIRSHHVAIWPIVCAPVVRRSWHTSANATQRSAFFPRFDGWGP